MKSSREDGHRISETSSRLFQLKIMETTRIQIFTNDIFGAIRTCLVNNQIMFVGKDVAKALGYKNVPDAISKHVDEEDKGVAKCDTLADRDLVRFRTHVSYSLVGENKLVGQLLNSNLWLKRLKQEIVEAKERGEGVWITIR